MLFVAEKGFWGFLGTVAGWLHSVGMQMGGPGLALIAFADSSFFSIPQGNDILIIILSTGSTWTRMLYLVGMTVLGSVAGCAVIYYAGRHGSGFFSKRLNGGRVEKFRETYHRWGIWSVMVPAILPPPTPFKVFVFSAGFFRIPFGRFLFAVAAGRLLRYLIWGSLAVMYGEPVRIFMQDNIQQVGIVLIAVLAAGLISFVGFRNLAGKRA